MRACVCVCVNGLRVSIWDYGFEARVAGLIVGFGLFWFRCVDC